MRICAIDPGGMSGIATFDNGEHEAIMLPFGDDQDWLEENLWQFQMLVCEDFNIGMGTLTKGQDGSKQTLETIGVARFLARKDGISFKLQQPADSRTFDPHWEKLKKLDWYTPGLDHARSASRHLLLACIELGQVDPKVLL